MNAPPFLLHLAISSFSILLSGSQGRESNIAIIPFYGKGKNSINFIKNNNSNNEWFSCSLENLPNLRNSINSINSRKANTPLFSAVDFALIEISNKRENEYQIILCLTDGNDNSSGSLSKDKLGEKLLKSGIPVVTMGYGIETDKGLNQSILEYISSSSGAGSKNIGSFVNVPIEEVSTILQQFALEISSAYEITWQSKFRKLNTPVEVLIDVSYMSNNGEIKAPTFKGGYELLAD